MSQTRHAVHAAPLDTDWDDVARRGQAHYDRHLRSKLEPAHTDQFVVIEVDSGQYFLGDTDQDALRRALDGCPDGLLYLGRVGYPAAIRLRHAG